jgi:hypothetical protein
LLSSFVSSELAARARIARAASGVKIARAVRGARAVHDKMPISGNCERFCASGARVVRV